MKKNYYLTILITFAATIINVFTSCGNDSELFEEPTIYETRATRSMDTKNENGEEGPKQQYITNGGLSTITKSIVLNEACLEVTFKWDAGYVSDVKCQPTVSIKDLNDETEEDIDYRDSYIYSFTESKKDPITMSNTGFADIRYGPYGESWAIDIRGTVIVEKLNVFTRDVSTYTHDLADSYYAEIPLIIIDKSVTNSPTFPNSLVDTPINFEPTDSLTTQNQ